LNFLDRGNIGNSKVLNSETGDDLLQQTGMTADNYAITVTLFSLAYGELFLKQACGRVLIPCCACRIT
jgi:hypothetical protein